MSFWAMVSSYNWLISAVISLLITFLAILAWNRCCKVLYERTSSTHHVWDDSLVYAVDMPLKMLILIYGVSYAIHALSANLITLGIFDSLLDPFELLCINLFILWFALRFINKIERALVKKPKSKRRFDKTTIRAVSQLCSVVVSVLIILNIMNPIFGVPISALLAFGGIGGIAVALACQDLLSNIFGGFYIYLDRPFDIGDWVSSPEKDIEGIIENIGWRLTCIRTFEKKLRYIPNSLFSKIIIDNPSRMSHRRIRSMVGIRYDDAAKLADIIKDVEKMIQEHPDIDADQMTYARFMEFGDSSLNFEVNGFTKKTKRADYLAVREDIYINIINIIACHNAECAFPTRTLHIKNDSAEIA